MRCFATFALLTLGLTLAGCQSAPTPTAEAPATEVEIVPTLPAGTQDAAGKAGSFLNPVQTSSTPAALDDAVRQIVGSGAPAEVNERPAATPGRE